MLQKEMKKNERENLNLCRIETQGRLDGQSLDDSSMTYDSEARVNIHLRDIEMHLCRYISEADVVVGCVAWLTSVAILRTLASVQGVQIVVQKEDFLRPDCDQQKGWKAQLHALYQSITPLDANTRSEFIADGLNRCSRGAAWVNGVNVAHDAIRCMGIAKRGPDHISPKMHNKFLVFCKREKYKTGDAGHNLAFSHRLAAYAAWTGSFNMTANASRSLENGVYINSSYHARAYFEEWANILALSEPLDWTSEWVDSDYRIGS